MADSSLPCPNRSRRQIVKEGKRKRAFLPALAASVVLAAVAGSPTSHHAVAAGVRSVAAAPAGMPASSARLGTVRFIKRGLAVQPPHHKKNKGRVNMPLFNGYFLQTKVGQLAAIRFADGTELDMNQETDAVLRSPSLTFVRKGEVRQIVTRGTNHKVQTSAAVAAVAAAIGTAFDVRVAGKTSFFDVIEGAVRVYNAKGSVVAKGGQQVVVVQGKKPREPVSASAPNWFRAIPRDNSLATPTATPRPTVTPTTVAPTATVAPSVKLTYSFSGLELTYTDPNGAGHTVNFSGQICAVNPVGARWDVTVTDTYQSNSFLYTQDHTFPVLSSSPTFVFALSWISPNPSTGEIRFLIDLGPQGSMADLSYTTSGNISNVSQPVGQVNVQQGGPCTSSNGLAQRLEATTTRR